MIKMQIILISFTRNVLERVHATNNHDNKTLVNLGKISVLCVFVCMNTQQSVLLQNYINELLKEIMIRESIVCPKMLYAAHLDNI